MKIFMLTLMLLIHVIADFTLQGLLATWKQKDWWKQNCPDKKYRDDWRICLFMHSLEWSILITLPWFVYVLCVTGIRIDPTAIFTIFFIVVIVNTLIHGVVDHKKCNEHKTNLIQDQLIHVLQIVATCSFCDQVVSKFHIGI